eukprot:4528855-Pyramimonas_sp.AAC.1
MHCGLLTVVDYAHTYSKQRNMLYAQRVRKTTLTLKLRLPPNGTGEESVWTLRTTLGEWNADVVEVRFSPPSKGLWLAAGAADGTIRLYEGLGAHLELKHWEMQVPLASSPIQTVLPLLLSFIVHASPAPRQVRFAPYTPEARSLQPLSLHRMCRNVLFRN